MACINQIIEPIFYIRDVVQKKTATAVILIIYHCFLGKMREKNKEKEPPVVSKKKILMRYFVSFFGTDFVTRGKKNHNRRNNTL